MKLRIKQTAASMAVLILLTGCQTITAKLPNIEPEIAAADVPLSPVDSWATPAPSETPRSDWVASFADAGWQAAVDEALAANPDIKATAGRLRAARASAQAAEAGLLPNVGADVSAGRSAGGDNPVFNTASMSFGASASWEVDLWGRVANIAEAADVDVAAAEADLAAARVSIAGATSQAWLNLIEANLLYELSERDVATQKRALELTERRFSRGVVGSSDVRLARSSVASSEALLALRGNVQAQSARQLEILMRRYPDNTIVATADIPPLPELSGAASPEYLLSHRPDILAAERRIAAAGLRVDIARKALLPRLSLSGSAGTAGSVRALDTLFDPQTMIASLVGGLTQTLFDNGARKAEVERNRAVVEQLLENYTSTVLTAYLEVENALDAESRLAERERALRVAVDEALEAERRLQRRYTEGLATILQLLDAQSRRINSESQLISARKERLANRVRLHVALGGGL